MKLIVNLRHLEKGPRRYKGSLAAQDLDLDLNDEVLKAVNPVEYEFEVSKQSQDLYLKGKFRTRVECVCVRCLKSFEEDVVVDPWESLIPLEGDEKVEMEGDCADLTPFLREDMLLDFPHHPVCKTGCQIIKRPESEKPKGEEAAVKSAEQSNVWSALDQLNLE